MSDLNITTITFKILSYTALGESISLVGDLSQLGTWNPNAAVKLSTSESTYPVWSVTVDLPTQTSIQYKYLTLRGEGDVLWEAIPQNRTLSVTGKRVTVDDGVFGNRREDDSKSIHVEQIPIGQNPPPGKKELETEKRETEGRKSLDEARKVRKEKRKKRDIVGREIQERQRMDEETKKKEMEAENRRQFEQERLRQQEEMRAQQEPKRTSVPGEMVSSSPLTIADKKWDVAPLDPVVSMTPTTGVESDKVFVTQEPKRSKKQRMKNMFSFTDRERSSAEKEPQAQRKPKRGFSKKKTSRTSMDTNGESNSNDKNCVVM